MEPITALIAANVAFVGSHFAMSHPLRAPMVKVLGEKGFAGVYSLVSFAALIWIVFAFMAVVPSVPFWSGFDSISWAIASVLTLVGLTMVVGANVGNPAMPAPGEKEKARAEGIAREEPQGLFRVTRHPMMWGFALIFAAHMIAAPTDRGLVVAVSMIALALVGAKLQDSKKEQQMGDAWAAWESKTSFVPRFTQLAAVSWKVWAIGAVLWLGVTWLHQPLGGWDAGLFRWL